MSSIFWQSGQIKPVERSLKLAQNPCCIWLTGLSGAGKSTLGYTLEKKLHQNGRHVYVLDGDNIRHGLNSDLGFSEEARAENIRRVAHVARLMVDAGLIVIVSFISPFQSEREKARQLFHPGQFLEVFVDAPLSTCEERDVKGLYAKARRGEIKSFTGIDSAYERPANPEIHLRTDTETLDSCLAKIIEVIEQVNPPT